MKSMGAGASAQGQSQNSAGNSNRQGNQENAPQYVVQAASDNMLNLPTSFLLRLESEAVVFVDIDTGERYHHYPYYTIMCWGHTTNTFQFRLYQPGTKVEAIAVKTRQGAEIERVILSVVKQLMKKMKQHGTSKEEFEKFMDIITTSEECVADPDVAIDRVQKFMEGHSITVNQARDIMEQLKFPSSFEKILVAEKAYHCMINKDAFQMILHCFDDHHDRLNLCHKLKLDEAMADGVTVKPTPEKIQRTPEQNKERYQKKLKEPFKDKVEGVDD